MGPSIKYSNIAFYSALPEQKVGYVSFARVFFFVNSVEKGKKNACSITLVYIN